MTSQAARKGSARGVFAWGRWLLAAGVMSLAGNAACAQDAQAGVRPATELIVQPERAALTSVVYRGRNRAASTHVVAPVSGSLADAGLIAPPTRAGGSDRGTCPPTTDSVAANFDGIAQNSPITLQLGLREDEGFGVVYSAPSTSFPLEITLIEQFFGTVAGGGGTITCGYTIEVYDGVPGSGGTLVFSVSSDPDPSGTGLPGDIVLQRLATCSTISGAQASAGKLQFSVDQTADPQDRIFVSNTSGTGQFTVFMRITRMNQPNPNPCAIFGGEEPACENIFLATEANNTGSLNFPTRNMLYAIDCPGNPFAAPGGFYRFSQLPTGVRPTRDVLQQVSWQPVQCAPPVTGACCALTGACTISTQGACTGTYTGDNTVCSPNPCPQPSGACCLPTGGCEVRSADQCQGTGFLFRGANTTCATANCPQPTGACCNGTACAPGLTQSSCLTLNGRFIGPGSVCGPNATCPLGACCLPTGACLGNLSSADCLGQGGTFQGVGSACASVSCPQPTGACCTAAGGCAEVTQATCSLFGGIWGGPLTTCTPTSCTSTNTGVCCRGVTCGAGVQASACTGANTVFLAGSTAGCPGTSLSPCCRADFNKIGGVTVQDIFDYLASWFSGDPIANYTSNGAGVPTVQSIFDFLAAWFAGGC